MAPEDTENMAQKDQLRVPPFLLNDLWVNYGRGIGTIFHVLHFYFNFWFLILNFVLRFANTSDDPEYQYNNL